MYLELSGKTLNLYLNFLQYAKICKQQFISCMNDCLACQFLNVYGYIKQCSKTLNTDGIINISLHILQG